MQLSIFLLAPALAMSLLGQTRVVNDGFPGENTAELETHLDQSLHKFKPDYVVLFAGGNDALNEKKFVKANETADHLKAMVQRIKAQHARVLLVTVHDPDLVRLMTRHTKEAYGDEPPLVRLRLVNEQIRIVALKEHVSLVPFADVLKRAGGANAELSTDGVHLTPKGYGLLAAAVRSHLPKHLSAHTTVLCFGDSLTYGIGVRPAGGAPETEQTYPAQLRALIHKTTISTAE